MGTDGIVAGDKLVFTSGLPEAEPQTATVVLVLNQPSARYCVRFPDGHGPIVPIAAIVWPRQVLEVVK